MNAVVDDRSILPAYVITKNGAIFDPSPDVWSYRDALEDVDLNFGKMSASRELLESIKYSFIWFAENCSPYYINNLYRRMVTFFTFLGGGKIISRFTLMDVANFYLSLDEDRAYILSCVAGVIKKLHSSGFGCVDDDLILYLNKIKIKGNKKGEAVLTMDPVRGPFSDLEFKALSSALNDAHRDERISSEDFLLGWLFLALGLRPIQYAALRVCDFSVTPGKQGAREYSLEIPRAKQRNAKNRGHFKNRRLLTEIGEKFVLHIEAVRTRFATILPDPDQAPLFPALTKDPEAPAGYEWHLKARQIGAKCQNIFDSFFIMSERTGGLLHITPYRFRYSVGTRAAMEGHREYVIAELLDHSDTQNVGVYVKATPEIIEHFTAAMAIELAPIADAFKGKVISSGAGSDRRKSIYAAEHSDSMRPTGSCGKHRKCELLEPLMCYTCRSFRPWLDGPHTAILTRLIEDRERLLKTPGSDLQIASINDLTILAVAEVVRQCERMLSEQGGYAND